MKLPFLDRHEEAGRLRRLLEASWSVRRSGRHPATPSAFWLSSKPRRDGCQSPPGERSSWPCGSKRLSAGRPPTAWWRRGRCSTCWD